MWKKVMSVILIFIILGFAFLVYIGNSFDTKNIADDAEKVYGSFEYLQHETHYDGEYRRVYLTSTFTQHIDNAQANSISAKAMRDFLIESSGRNSFLSDVDDMTIATQRNDGSYMHSTTLSRDRIRGTDWGASMTLDEFIEKAEITIQD